MLLKCLLVAKYSPQQKMLVYCVTHWHPLAKLHEPPWNVLWARNQPPVPDPYSQSLVCATWTIPRASTHISLPQSYESKVLTSPFSLIAHFFPGLAIICLTPSLPGFHTVRQMVWCKTTDKTFSSLETVRFCKLRLFIITKSDPRWVNAHFLILFDYEWYLRNWTCSGGRVTLF